MKVTTNREISYSLRLTVTEARKLHRILEKVANSNSVLFNSVDQVMCKDLGNCLRDEVYHSEGLHL